MLIYNFQKEFLGIDEKSLHMLGYKDLAELHTEVTDFADLFVKTPGHIHNFQHVHWIDYITCAESNEESKVIIHANAKNYKAVITVTNAYLTDNPNQKAYLVHLNNLRALTTQEYDAVSDDIIQKPAPQKTSVQQVPPTPQTKKEEILELGDLSVDTHEAQEAVEKPKESLKSTESQLHVQTTQEKAVPKEKTLPKKETRTKSDYLYDPNVASKELGLPLDLIEEFIQDFINQANDFKADLYRSLHNGDIDNVKTLSHKLKGVAANLRIEDAFEVLSIINTSSDTDVIQTNLDSFYAIITKLAGKEEANPIKDEEVPQKIEIPELYDDEFVAPEESEEPLTFKEDEPELTLELQEEETPTLKIDSQPQERIEIKESEDKYSKEKIANEIGLDMDSFNDLFDEFIKEAHTILTKIDDALATQDYKALKQLALKLKGMSDNMRIQTFTKELDLLIHSTDENAFAKAVNEIKNRLTIISKEEE